MATACDLGSMTGVSFLAVTIVLRGILRWTWLIRLLIRLVNLHKVLDRSVLMAPPLTIACGVMSLIPCRVVVCDVSVLSETLTLGVSVLLRNLFPVDIILRPAEALKLIMMYGLLQRARVVSAPMTWLVLILPGPLARTGMLASAFGLMTIV